MIRDNQTIIHPCWMAFHASSGRLAPAEAKFNVVANCIAPGLVDTPLYRHLRVVVQEKARRAQPSRKVGAPEHITYAAHFFAAEEAWYMTGRTICVCGGSIGSFIG